MEWLDAKSVTAEIGKSRVTETSPISDLWLFAYLVILSPLPLARGCRSLEQMCKRLFWWPVSSISVALLFSTRWREPMKSKRLAARRVSYL
jgi:hypothetical protein